MAKGGLKLGVGMTLKRQGKMLSWEILGVASLDCQISQMYQRMTLLNIGRYWESMRMKRFLRMSHIWIVVCCLDSHLREIEQWVPLHVESLLMVELALCVLMMVRLISKSVFLRWLDWLDS